MTILHLDGVLRRYDAHGRRVSVDPCAVPDIVLHDEEPQAAHVHRFNEAWKRGEIQRERARCLQPVEAETEG